MNLASWVRYCRDKDYKRPADEINYAPHMRYLDNGESWFCNEGCNPWECVDCCDGFGMGCSFIMSNGEHLPYYIPDPYDEDERKEWLRIVKLLPPHKDTQLSLF